jgi:site-specific DNA-cytosine methylase
LNVLSLFDGISCGQVALERAGIKVEKYFASEIEQDAITVALHNYPKMTQLGSVTDWREWIHELPKIDLLIGGSPCQGLSKSKQGRQNLDDPRSKLFYEYVNIRNWLIENNNPELRFLLENVKPNEETRQIMTEEMGVEPVEINSVIFSAQRRIRLYWTNIEVADLPPSKELNVRDIIYDNTYKHITITNEKLLDTVRHTKHYAKWDTSFKGHYSQANRAYYMDATMGTVPHARASSKMNIWLGDNVYRRIHPIEGERLQTLPDNYTAVITAKNDDIRVGLVGNGWTVDVIAHIFKGLTGVK